MTDTHEVRVRPDQQIILERFINACQKDESVIAAFLGGSYAKGTSDDYSDLDINLITTDRDFDEFCANRNEFLRQLGVPAFMDSFGIPNIVCFIFDNGVEGDLIIGRESQFESIHTGPYQVLLDKKRLLVGAVFNRRSPELSDQIENLRRLISWFWHDWIHFTTAMRREQLWWAQGQLEVLRGYCVSLIRLIYNFYDEEAGDEPYFKIEKASPVKWLSELKATVGPLEREQLLKAGRVILEVYQEIARALAKEHGIPYPEVLAGVLMKRLEGLD